MATLNFPDAPDTGDIYTDSNSGFSYEWNGSVWISIDPSTASNIREIDDISSSFNGTTSQFTLQVSGVNIEPDSDQSFIEAFEKLSSKQFLSETLLNVRNINKNQINKSEIVKQYLTLI